MPISKVDYNTNNTVIYKIYCLDVLCDFVYFGSTTNFATRKSQHKHSCNNENNPAYNYNLYKMIRDNKGWDNFEMCLVEVFACENKQQLLIREQFHIDSHRNNMNTKKAFISIEDQKEHITTYMKAYRENNTEHIATYMKAYRENNTEHIATYQKAYRENNTEHIATYKKAYNTNYNEINKDAKKIYNTKYNEINKEAISKKRKEAYQAKKLKNAQVNNLPN